MALNPDLIGWLLEGAPWVVYRTRRDLLGCDGNDPQVETSRQAMVAHPLVQGLVTDLQDWPKPLLNSHKSANQPMHKLSFLVDLGLRKGDPGMAPVVERVLARQSAQGPFQMLTNISPAYGGSGEDEYAWALCDAPVVVYSLVRLGLGEDQRVQQAAAYLVSLVRENGWPCAVSPELGKWRGPGRKEDPCPYANLVMLKLLAELPEYRHSPAARAGAETALNLWEHSLERHPYIFYMGTDFRKLKAPFIWYDILHLVEVLSHFPWLHNDPRLGQMVDLLYAKGDEMGRFTPESVWKAYSGWDFGQKKTPSPWLTLLVWRIFQRLEPAG